jgi:hypothetical protein
VPRLLLDEDEPKFYHFVVAALGVQQEARLPAAARTDFGTSVPPADSVSFVVAAEVLVVAAAEVLVVAFFVLVVAFVVGGGVVVVVVFGLPVLLDLQPADAFAYA